MSKMKLCPCCQGEGAVRYKEIFAGVIPRPQWPVIQCDECGLATKPYPTEAEAIAAWNQRAGEAITSGYYQVEPIGEQPPTITTTYCQGCQEKEAELTTLRAQLIATQDSREKAETEMDRLNEIVGRQHAELTRLRDLERAVGAIRAEYKSEVWQALEKVYALRKEEQALHDERTHLMAAYVQAWCEGYRKGKADHLQELEMAVRDAMRKLPLGRGWVWRGDSEDIATIGRLLEAEGE